jgi:hypothetical protein
MEANVNLCFGLIDDQLKVLNKILIYVNEMHNSLEVLNWNKVRRLERGLLRSWSKFKVGNNSLRSQLTKIGSLEAEKFIGKLIDIEVIFGSKLSRRNGNIISILRSKNPDIHLLNNELNDLVSKGINEGRSILNKLSRFISK